MRVFINRDPAGFVDGPNLYTYVKQNPWTGFDPEGLADEEIVGTPEEDIEETGAGLRNNDPERDADGKPIFGSEEYEKENPPPSQAPSGPTPTISLPGGPTLNSGATLKSDDEIALEVAKEMEQEKSNTPGSETQKQQTDDNKEKTGDSTSPPPTKPDAKPIDSTRPQHGTSEHDATAFNDALNKQNTPGNSDARFNQQLTDTKGNAVPGYRPDSQTTRTQEDGTKVKDVTEVQSPSQSDAEMAAKKEAMTKALGSEAGNIQVIKPTPGATRNTSPPPANP